jgi:hypothetical protein
MLAILSRLLYITTSSRQLALFGISSAVRIWFMWPNIIKPLMVSVHLAGKRYNVLRNRTDPWDYDVDQLLFGTILFTLLAFLFPTVLAYYLLFAVVSGACLTPGMHSFLSLDALLCHIALRKHGNVAGFHESLPSVRVGTSSERSLAIAWFDIQSYPLNILTVAF